MTLLAAADPVGDSALDPPGGPAPRPGRRGSQPRRGGRPAGHRRERALPASAGPFGRLPGGGGQGPARRARRARGGDRSAGRPRPPGVAPRARDGRTRRGRGRRSSSAPRAGPCAGAGWRRPPPSGSEPSCSPRTRASAPRGRSRRPRRSTRRGISRPRRPSWPRPRSGRSSELGHALVQRMRAQVAFALRRGSDAPPLLLRAAQRLADPGRRAGPADLPGSPRGRDLRRPGWPAEQDVVEVGARGEIRACPGRRRCRTGCSAAWRCGWPTGTRPPPRCSARRCGGTGPSRRSWTGCASPTTWSRMDLWDDQAWFELATGQVRLARANGTLSWLPFALDYLAEIQLQAGELAGRRRPCWRRASVSTRGSGRPPCLTSRSCSPRGAATRRRGRADRGDGRRAHAARARARR